MSVHAPSPAQLGPARFASLDGLRGIAAVIVLMFHFEQSHGTRSVFASGYLAVDFFFLLSGFVLVGPFEGGRAGPRRSNSATMIARFLRFWPLMALGVVMGAAVQFFRWPADQVLPLLALGVMSIPLAWKAGDAFALNGPQWSLFVELVWNALHIVLLRKVRSRVLLALSFACGVVLVWFADRLTTEALGRQYDEILIGLVRAGFAYPLGIVIGRKQHLLGALPQVAGWIAPALLVGAVVLPALLSLSPTMADTFARGLFVAVLVLGIRSRLGDDAARTMTWLGAISFPLYVVHAPILEVANTAAHAAPEPWRPMIFLAGLAMVFVVANRLSRSAIAHGIRFPGASRTGPSKSAAVAQSS